MDEWKIQTRSGLCHQCHQEFVADAACYTILGVEMGQHQRKDLCRECWESEAGVAVRNAPGVISSWQGIYEPPAPPPPDPLPKEDAESILRRMLERNDPAESEARYILAVMLERKRILKHRETKKAESTLLVYEYVRTGEVFVITDPQLHLDRLQVVQRRVAEMLKPSETAAPVMPVEAAVS